MSKGTEAFNNILAEGDFRYFSSLYDRDMFREDVITVKKELEALEIIRKVFNIEISGNNICFVPNEYETTQKEDEVLKEVLYDEHR